MKEENHVFQGLKRDTHQIRQKSEFLWDAHNIRLTNREDNTLLSITNEKGTSGPLSYFLESYVGHCVLGKYLVVFTANKTSGYSYIYRVEKVDDTYNSVILYEGNLNLSPKHPIEALGIYETEFVQKVYWVDGVNQPRVINITKPEYLGESSVSPYYVQGEFDFIRTLNLKEIVEVHKSYGSGKFSSGVIQYALSYYNKYGQESNIFYTTPLQYISHKDRGGSPEEAVGNSFLVKINNVDTNFDYIRLYSIHRTSIDSTPTVKVVSDIQISGKAQHSYLDNGTVGYVIDPTQLLYIGGETIVASTIAHKDNTLFLGNIVTKGAEKDTQLKSAIASNYTWVTTPNPPYKDDESQYSTYYYYNPDLSRSNSASFTTKETYRTGIQVQYENGKWSSPIFIEDKVLRLKYPWDNGPLANNEIQLYQAACTKLRKLGAKKVRACVVLPTLQDREVICQGILCPTVYWVEGRKKVAPYAMSSWFFRAATGTPLNFSKEKGANIQFEHNRELLAGAKIGAEIQNMVPVGDSSYGDFITKIDSADKAELFKSSFFVDENIVTFHSPDIEFDQNLWNYPWEGVKLRIIGMAGLGAISGDIDIQTSTPALEGGFEKLSVGYQTKNNIAINGGLVTTGSYIDKIVLNDFSTDKRTEWTIYPWHRSGSLNNDASRPEEKGTRSSVLSKKKISNLKYFHKNDSLEFESPLLYDISTPQLHTSNEVSLLKLHPSHLGMDITYMGNIDTLITAGQEYPIYAWGSKGPFDLSALGSTLEVPPIESSKEAVRMKYKSTPHAVFSLGSDYNKIPILPRHTSVGEELDESFNFPNWWSWGSEDGSNDIKGEYDYVVRFALTNKEILDEKGINSTWIGNAALIKNTDDTYSVYIAKANPYGNYWLGLNSDSNGEKVLITNRATYCDGVTFEGLPTQGVGNYNGNDILYQLTWEGSDPKDNKFKLTPVPLSKPMAPSNRTFKITRSVFGTSSQALPSSYMLIGELYRDKEDSKFGGTSEEAISQNLWIPAGDPIEIPTSGSLQVPFKYGDTWYSRYDCLKTYPFTQEDENSIIDIGSFMLETRVNIDGRYDKNRGQLSNLYMTPQNFNLINPIYSQKDNFFNYRILDEDYSKQSVFKNQITWTKEKFKGEEIDTWTNITLANTLDLIGDQGTITSLKVWNENILCFQERGLSQILFNSRVQIPVTDGVPIEISNGYKVDGSRSLSNTIGCTNKWSIVATPYGVYFIDANTKSIYLYNGQLNNLSRDKGMDWWVKSNNPSNIWSATKSSISDYGIRTFYDNIHGDVYFTPGYVDNIQPEALCYSESLGQFTSLMSYGGVPAMFNLGGQSYSLYQDLSNRGSLSLYKNFEGDYNYFFNKYKGWSFSFIANENPTYTKVFDTIELRTDLYDEKGELKNSCPVNFLRVSNEYQDSSQIAVDTKNMRKKFRIWRGLLPRNKDTRQRIRNPWSMITLGWKPSITEQSSNTNKAIVHDVSVKYTV